MTYTSRTRDRYRLAVTGVTTVVAAAAVVATGWLAGAAAHEQAQREAETNPDAVVRERPLKTRDTTRYADETTPAPVGPGGEVTSPDPASSAPSVPAPSSGS